MRNIRSCVANTLATGKSGCQIEFGKIRSIILVPHGTKLLAISQGVGGTLGEALMSLLGASSLKAACHADLPNRIYPIKDIVEYAKNGGEPQVSAVGYGGSGVTGLSARTDTFTIATYNEQLAASLTKNMNRRFDAYYVDENSVIYGIQKDDNLYGFPLETVYCTVTPHPTSSAKATMTVSCCLENAREAIEKLDYIQAKFDVNDALVGLVPFDLMEVATGKWKLIETVGGYDLTETYGETIVTNHATIMDGVTSISYADGLLTITSPENATPAFKKPSVTKTYLPGLEYNATVTPSAS